MANNDAFKIAPPVDLWDMVAGAVEFQMHMAVAAWNIGPDLFNHYVVRQGRPIGKVLEKSPVRE